KEPRTLLGFRVSQETASPTLGLSLDFGEMTVFLGTLGVLSMACRLTKEDTVHWYKQLPGQPIKRILYVSGQIPAFDDSSDRQKYQVRKRASEPLYSLQINNVNQRDAGT
uniref:Immunoglobulin V-set domain-containing protein n=1 Tax=Anas platyrhynchos TaxID=8839 RepID=A0A8B9TS75_ANAPL